MVFNATFVSNNPVRDMFWGHEPNCNDDSRYCVEIEIGVMFSIDNSISHPYKYRLRDVPLSYSIALICEET